MAKIKIGLVQSRGYPDKEKSLARHLALIQDAAARGGQIICLQELFLTPYFCKREDTALFDLAEPVPGKTTDALGKLAEEELRRRRGETPFLPPHILSRSK